MSAMNQDPAPVEPASPTGYRRLHPLPTTLAAVLLVLWTGVCAAATLLVPPLKRLDHPTRALEQLAAQIDVYGQVQPRLPAWERALDDFFSGGFVDNESQLREWYRELAAQHPDALAQLHVTILDAERSGWTLSLDQRVSVWTREPSPLPAYAQLARAAYGLTQIHDAAVVWSTLDQVPGGWFHDMIGSQLARRLGDQTRLAQYERAQQARAARYLLVWRVDLIVELVLIIIGVTALVWLFRHPQPVLGTAALPPPWPWSSGFAVVVRAVALGVMFSVFVGLGLRLIRVRQDELELCVGWLVICLPLFVMTRKHLLKPAGGLFTTTFGLRAPAGGWSRCAVWVLATVGVSLVVEDLLSRAMYTLPGWFHWTESFDETVAFGSPGAVIVSLVFLVLIGPISEEFLFRGLVFGSLRRRFGWGWAATISAAIFAGAHFYGRLGTLCIFWDGLLLAWLYEETRSLIPCMAVHIISNLILCPDLLLLRPS